MHIFSNGTLDCEQYELDVTDVGMKSLSEQDIKLPYSGNISGNFPHTSSAYVYLNVQLTQGVRIFLSAEMENGSEVRYPIHATTEEITSIMDKFLEQSPEQAGLAPYWLGLWAAHYIEWRRIAMWPKNMLDVLWQMPIEDREFLMQHMMDDETE